MVKKLNKYHFLLKLFFIFYILQKHLVFSLKNFALLKYRRQIRIMTISKNFLNHSLLRQADNHTF